ncbi:MAG TPA: hypothetical protein VGP82_09015 [Ktedonobacterales bacterium]|nr:hypothetical protein [Ktedonobacterales bacterium]
MSWYTLVNIAEGVPAAFGAPAASSWGATLVSRSPTPRQATSSAPLALGSAQAAARWSWADPSSALSGRSGIAEREHTHLTAEEQRRVRVARDLLRLMANAAYARGCSEDDIWNEAAREWLLRHTRNDEPPPTSPAAAPIPRPRPARSWDTIDAVLAQLRHLQSAPATEPAA